MANPTWPPALPQFVLQDGFQHAEPITGLETTMEAGPAKTRSRYTSNTSQMSVQMKMTVAQLALLRVFFRETTVGGTLPFDWVDPLTRVAATFRFRPQTPPAVSGVIGEAIVVTVAMEQF